MLFVVCYPMFEVIIPLLWYFLWFFLIIDVIYMFCSKVFIFVLFLFIFQLRWSMRQGMTVFCWLIAMCTSIMLYSFWKCWQSDCCIIWFNAVTYSTLTITTHWFLKSLLDFRRIIYETTVLNSPNIEIQRKMRQVCDWPQQSSNTAREL